MSNLRLYPHFIGMYLKARLEYRVSFLLDIFMPMFSYGMNYLVIWLLLDKFQSIHGWSRYEVMFLYTLNLLSYGLAGMFLLAPMRSLESLVSRGEFDGMLTRPVNPFLYLVYRQFQHIFIGHLVLSGIVFALCLARLQIVWSAFNVVWLLVVVAGGALIQGAFFVVTGSLSFWFMNSTTISTAIINSLRGFTEYPLVIYDRVIQVALTFVLPYAFINFYPAEHFLAKEALFHPAFRFGTPLVGVVLFVLAYALWKRGVDSYQSAGA